MYTVNTSFMVEPDAHEHWLQIIRTKYVPFLRENGYDRILLTRVLESEMMGHFTYSLQVVVEDIEQYQHLSGKLFEEYVQIMTPIFGEKVLWFTSLLKHIDTDVEA